MITDALTWGLRTFAVLFAALVAIALLGFATGIPQAVMKSESRTITIPGYAETKVLPDTIEVSASVSTVAKASVDALDQNNTRVAAVLAGLKQSGVADKDVRTTGFSVSPQHPRDGNGYAENEMVTIGYIVTNTIIVRLAANADAGKLVDRLARLGITAVSGMRYIVADTSETENVVHERAVQNARLRAERVVKALGAKLGPVLKIEDNDRMSGAWGLHNNTTPSRYAPESAQVAVLPQGQSIATALSVTFAIE